MGFGTDTIASVSTVASGGVLLLFLCALSYRFLSSPLGGNRSVSFINGDLTNNVYWWRYIDLCVSLLYSVK